MLFVQEVRQHTNFYDLPANVNLQSANDQLPTPNTSPIIVNDSPMIAAAIRIML